MTVVSTQTLQDVRSCIDQGKLMSLATTAGVRLHMCTVWYAASNDHRRLYFTSRETRAHSVNIRNNGLVSGGIVVVELEGLGQRTQGLFFSGIAREANGAAISEWYGIYSAKWPKVAEMFSIHDIEAGRTPMRMYEVAVEEYVWIDEVSSPADPRFVINPDQL